MKPRLSRALFTALLTAMAVLPCTLADNTLNLYILTGQSNSLGAVKGAPASTEMLAEYSTANTSNILMWNGCSSGSGVLKDANATWVTVAPHAPTYEKNLCMGPEYGFAHMMTRKGWEVNTDTNDSIAIIKTSCDGGGNDQWVKGHVFYNTMLASIKKAYTALSAANAKAAPEARYTTINIVGLLYLQGESNTTVTQNYAAQRYAQLIQDLKTDLSAEGYGEAADMLTYSVAGEPATKGIQRVDNSVGSVSANQLMTMADNSDNMGWVFTRDLDKWAGETPLHYTGASQITIGARYAYNFAREKGYDLTEGGTISVRSQEFTGCGDYPGSTDTSLTPNVTYAKSPGRTINLNDDVAWWDGNAAGKANVIAVWDVSSANQEDTLSADFAVGGIRVEDPYIDTVTIGNASGVDATLTVGAKGIELQGKNLAINTKLHTTGNQTWTVADGRSLAGNGATSGTGAISLVHSGDLVEGSQVSVAFGTEADTHTWNVGAGVEFGALACGESVTLGNVTLAAGAALSLGGDAAVGLTINSLTATNGGSFAFNLVNSTSYDHLALGDASSLAGDFVFNVAVSKKVSSTNTYTLVDNWLGGSNFTGNVTCAKGMSGELSLVGNTIVLTLTGSADGTVDYANHHWPTTETTSTITASGDFYAGNSGENTHYTARTSTGDLFFFASKSSGEGDTYAELTDATANWVSALGASSYKRAVTITGNSNLKVSGTAANTYTVYGAVNGTIHGNAYLELANPNATYSSVNGTYNATIDGKLTFVFQSGTFTGDVYGGSVNTATSIAGGLYMQINGGTFNSAVNGGSKISGNTINNGVHMVINGGTFNGDILGAGTNGTVNGGVEMIITGGTFNDAKGIYAGGDTNATVTGGTTVTLQKIANGNSFLNFTGTLSGGHKDGHALDGAHVLELDNYTADSINATLTSFTEISAVNGTNTTLPVTTARGGATSISVDDTSTLKMAAEAGNMGTLHGEGRVEVTTGTGTKDTAFTLGDDWTGTVALSDKVIGASGNDLIYNFNNYGRKGSTIELTGLGTNPSNYSYIHGKDTFAADFVLKEDANGIGLFLNAGSSSATYTFTGAWSGDGDFRYSPASNVTATFVFAGDMSKYNGDYLVSCGATLKFGNGGIGAADGSVSGMGDISGTGSNTAHLEYNYSNNVKASNFITGNVDLVKKGSGTLTLSNENNYTGTTTVEGGKLYLESVGRTGTGRITIKAGAAIEQENFCLTSGSADSTITMPEGTSLTAIAFAVQSMTAGTGTQLTLNGNLETTSLTTGAGFQGTGTGTLTLTGDSSIGAAGVKSNVAHNIVVTGTTTLSVTNAELAHVSGTSSTTYNLGEGGVINLAATAGSQGKLTGSGRVVLTGDGGTDATAFTLDKGWTGTVVLTDKVVGKKGNDIIFNFNNYGQAGSTIELNGFGVAPGRYSYISAGGTFGADFVLNATETSDGVGLYINAGSTGANYNFTGAWSGSGNLKLGSSTPGANFRFKGDMTKFAGDFISESGNGRLFFGDGSTGATTGSVSGTGAITTSGNGAFALEYNYSNNVTTANTISGNVTLTKQGAGKLTLTGANTYTGATTVNAGTLALTGAGSTGTGKVVINANAALQTDKFGIANGANATATLTVDSNGLTASSIGAESITLAGTGVHTITGNVQTNTLTSAGTLRLDNAGLSFWCGTNGKAYNLGAVDVKGTSAITSIHADANVGISALSSNGDATLTLCNNTSGTNTHTFNLGTSDKADSAAAFTGTINVEAGPAYTTADKKTTTDLVITEENIAAGAVINFSSTSTRANNLNLKLDASTVNVAGITTDSSLHTGEVPVITTTSGTKTLGLTGAGDYEAQVSLTNVNITKTGTGTQTFTGDATGVKDISVSAGTLAFVDAGVISGSAISISGEGKLVFGHTEADSVTLGAAGDTAATVASTISFDSSKGAIRGSGTISKAKVDFTGSASQTVSAEVLFDSCAMSNSGGGDIVIKGDTTTLDDVVVEEGSITFESSSENGVTVDKDKTLEVSKEGTLAFSKGEETTKATVTIKAKDETTTAQVGSGVTFNSSEAAIAGNGTVSDAIVEFSGKAEQTVAAEVKLNGCSIVNASEALVKINVGADMEYDTIHAKTEGITLLNIDSTQPLTVKSIQLESDQIFSAYVGNSTIEAQEATIRLSNLVSLTESYVNANLVFTGNYTLTLGGAVIMGSTLDLGTSGTLNLVDPGVAIQILFSSVDELFINGVQITSDGEIFANKLFTNAIDMSGIRWHQEADNTWTVTYYAHIPEPATATLSLLALAALTARRRRKH